MIRTVNVSGLTWRAVPRVVTAGIPAGTRAAAVARRGDALLERLIPADIEERARVLALLAQLREGILSGMLSRDAAEARLLGELRDLERAGTTRPSGWTFDEPGSVRDRFTNPLDQVEAPSRHSLPDWDEWSTRPAPPWHPVSTQELVSASKGPGPGERRNDPPFKITPGPAEPERNENVTGTAPMENRVDRYGYWWEDSGQLHEGVTPFQRYTMQIVKPESPGRGRDWMPPPPSVVLPGPPSRDPRGPVRPGATILDPDVAPSGSNSNPTGLRHPSLNWGPGRRSPNPGAYPGQDSASRAVRLFRPVDLGRPDPYPEALQAQVRRRFAGRRPEVGPGARPGGTTIAVEDAVRALLR